MVGQAGQEALSAVDITIVIHTGLIFIPGNYTKKCLTLHIYILNGPYKKKKTGI